MVWGEHRTGEELKEKMEDDGGWDGLEDDFCFELDDDGRIANTAEHVDCSTAVSTIACLDGGPTALITSCGCVRAAA